jgi:hypothetical protein
MSRQVNQAVARRCLTHFRQADQGWAQHAGDRRLPMLLLPADLFRWTEELVYFANSALMELDGAPALVLELRAFDAAARQRGEVEELDWCIPMDHPAATQRDRDKWALGLGEGWCDSFEVLTLIFTREWSAFFGEVAKSSTLVLRQAGQKTASLLQQLERNRDDIARFTADRVSCA